MTKVYFRSGFFAFLGMVLIAVCVALLLNAPPESSLAAGTSVDTAAMDGDYVTTEPADAPVIDARIETDTQSIDVVGQKS